MAGGNGSGAKLNPAVSTALFVARAIEGDVFAAELAAQFSGLIREQAFFFFKTTRKLLLKYFWT